MTRIGIVESFWTMQTMASLVVINPFLSAIESRYIFRGIPCTVTLCVHIILEGLKNNNLHLNRYTHIYVCIQRKNKADLWIYIPRQNLALLALIITSSES